MDAGHPCRFVDLVAALGHVAVGQIVVDGLVEQHRVLYGQTKANDLLKLRENLYEYVEQSTVAHIL